MRERGTVRCGAESHARGNIQKLDGRMDGWMDGRGIRFDWPLHGSFISTHVLYVDRLLCSAQHSAAQHNTYLSIA